MYDFLSTNTLSILSIDLTADQSPPKREFKVSDPQVRNLTLAELQLAPSSVLLLRFEDESLNGWFNSVT